VPRCDKVCVFDWQVHRNKLHRKRPVVRCLGLRELESGLCVCPMVHLVNEFSLYRLIKAIRRGLNDILVARRCEAFGCSY
jgi:hypothetical protein